MWAAVMHNLFLVAVFLLAAAAAAAVYLMTMIEGRRRAGNISSVSIKQELSQLILNSSLKELFVVTLVQRYVFSNCSFKELFAISKTQSGVMAGREFQSSSARQREAN